MSTAPLSRLPRSAPTSPVGDGPYMGSHRRTRTVQVSGMFGELSWCVSAWHGHAWRLRERREERGEDTKLTPQVAGIIGSTLEATMSPANTCTNALVSPNQPCHLSPTTILDVVDSTCPRQRANSSVALAPISEEHKEQRGTPLPHTHAPPSHPHSPYTPHTPSSLGPRRLPPVEALTRPPLDFEPFGLGRRRERTSSLPQHQQAPLPPPISTPYYPPDEAKCPETPSPRTPSPPVTPETPDIETRRVRDNMDDLQRQFAKQLCM